MPEILRIVTAVVALVLAAWAGYFAWRDRAPNRALLIGPAVLEIFAIALVVAAFTHTVGGHHPHQSVTFIAYVIAFLVIPPAGLVLARMEPTKWGSVIIAVAGIVQAILVVRLQQTYTGVG